MNKTKRLVKKPLYKIYESRILKFLDRDKLPQHIGVIHDGHRRYARAERLPDYAASYREGMKKFVEFLGWAEDLEIHAVTCWLLSTENLSRPAEELEPYYDVLVDLFRDIPAAIEGHDVAVRFVGSLDLLPQRLLDAAKELEATCNTGSRHVTIALAYGGRQEIVDATRELVDSLAEEGVTGAAMSERITAVSLGSFMYSADLPDPDLVIRTSGETRLSGFLLWQAAYAEFSFVDVYWPEFRRVDFLRALRDFTLSTRRYGK
ncbi:MAG: di-trans,poly-cis-decaprenylcistransferase [bacterium]|nr:di-trans,poly-cis-decaprenylcistransferase [bacterium]MCP4964061.1 di-trans,poly-cis-decaprenylcistransferase [bacterium]